MAARWVSNHLPPDLLSSSERRRWRVHVGHQLVLRRGVKFIFVGLALFVLFIR
jgi:hypothetical protein